MILAEPREGFYRPGEYHTGEGLFLYESADGFIVGEVRANNQLGTSPKLERFGGGPEFSHLMRDCLRTARLNTADFAQYFVRDSRPATLPHPPERGFPTVEIRVQSDGNDLDFQTEALGPTLDLYSRKDPIFKRLKDPIDQVEQCYARDHLRYIVQGS